jgi:hypothetical protein
MRTIRLFTTKERAENFISENELESIGNGKVEIKEAITDRAERPQKSYAVKVSQSVFQAYMENQD